MMESSKWIKEELRKHKVDKPKRIQVSFLFDYFLIANILTLFKKTIISQIYKT